MLVAIAVLAILVVLFAQMLGVMSRAWVYGHNRANNFTKARAMLDLLARDFQSGIFRPDLAALPASGSLNTLEFYTLRPGVPGNAATGAVRYASLVQYSLPANSTTLERSDAPIMWNDPASYLAFGNTAGFASPAAGAATPTLTQRDTAAGVIAFQIVFLQAPSSSPAVGAAFSTTTFTPLVNSAGVANANPTRAVGISLAVIDDQTLLLMSHNQLSNLNQALTSAVSDSPPLHNIKAYWDSYLKGASMNWQSYPKSLGTGLATFERYVTLPTNP
jgi:hypothetical protein